MGIANVINILIPFIVTIVITPIIRRFALKKGFVDKADENALKIHKESVALLGGVAVLVAVIAGMLVMSYGLGVRSYGRLWRMFIGGLFVFGVGVWDDLRGVKPIVRLLIGILAGVIVLLAGFRMSFISIPGVAIPLTLFYIVGAINAFNVTDGMDGLCAGISLIACVGFFFMGFNSQNIFLMILSSIIFMSLLGFLPYNFYPAKIFLGDAGSGLLGFLLGTMAVLATSKPYNIINFITPILIVGIPVFDMAFAILRRAIRKKPLFMGDRDHIYDLLLKRGMSQPKVWIIVCGAQFALMWLAVIAGWYYG